MARHQLLYLLVLLISIFFGCNSNGTSTNQALSEEKLEPSAQLTYDSLKAQTYGADNYGMKKYVFAFLKRGSNRTLDSLKAAELQMAHLENIQRMAEEGKLVLAGPFFGNQDLRGIYVFNVETIAKAEALTNSDPAIQAGSLEMELIEWYGSAALMEVNRIHETLMKKSITE